MVLDRQVGTPLGFGAITLRYFDITLSNQTSQLFIRSSGVASVNTSGAMPKTRCIDPDRQIA
jgi:hypothetical protein